MTEENRRSDSIRARRAGRAASERKPAAPRSTPAPRSTRKPTRASPEHYQAPVVVRASPRDLPMAAHKRGSKRSAPVEPRRRFDLALNVPGAEIRLPSLPRVEIGMRWLSLGLVVFFGWLLNYLWTSPGFQVGAAQVSGLQRVTALEVNQVLGVLGQPVFGLNAVDLEEKIRQTFPEFSQVAVQVEFPNVVKVDVTERVPVLIWDNGGQANLIDSQGYAFPLRYELTDDLAALEGFPLVHASGLPPMPLPVDENTSVPTVSLFGWRLPSAGSAPQLVPAEMVNAVLTLQGHAPQGVEIVYAVQHGLGWRDARGWTAFFGDARNMEMKLRVYEALVQHMAAEEIEPELISVEHIHAPYYRLEH